MHNKKQNKDVILQLENIYKTYPSGEEDVLILRGINLDIYRGEMVAIIGASGSGKSTLMNILGCLDHVSSGSYSVSGKCTAELDSDALSAFRRNHFGFIFQRYHLLGALTALGNVEIPAIYSNIPSYKRRKRAVALLERLGMGDRITHRPSQLSGGQQQRVSIARALMNNPEIILADEPTGALDKQSGEEVLRILDELHQEGRTIILVTHDSNVAARADRIIEISDGQIIADHKNLSKLQEKQEQKAKSEEEYHNALEAESLSSSHWYDKYRSTFDRTFEAFLMAILSLNAHRMRTFLTMLGVIIGIAAVVSMVALGNGTKAQIMDNLSGFNTNTLNIYPGKSIADRRAGKITTLVDSDATALSKQPYVMAATPNVGLGVEVKSGSISARGTASGVGAQYFKTQDIEPSQGRFFDEDEVKARALDVVLEEESAKTLFPDSNGNAVNKIVIINGVLMRVIGIYKSKFGQSNSALELYMPYTTLQTRFLGTTKVGSITVRIKDDIDTKLAENAIKKFLTMRHGSEDFFILNTEEFRQRILQSFQVLTLLVSSIALISLLVGGIGVMNIMLVTVSERINEIGVRMAVGARQSDILQQFLIEAIMVCLLGGIFGILLSMTFGWLIGLSGTMIKFIYTTSSIVVAVLFSSFIGISFGFFPARNASRLDPVEALARD